MAAADAAPTALVVSATVETAVPAGVVGGAGGVGLAVAPLGAVPASPPAPGFAVVTTQ